MVGKRNKFVFHNQDMNVPEVYHEILPTNEVINQGNSKIRSILEECDMQRFVSRKSLTKIHMQYFKINYFKLIKKLVVFNLMTYSEIT